MADTEFAHGGFGRKREAEVGEEHGGEAVHFEPVDAEAARAAARGAAEENVFGDAEFLDKRKFLGDDGEARALGIADGVEGDGAVVDAEFALVGAVRVDAGEEFDEGRLARAVFAAEGVDFAGAEVEGDVPQGGDAGEFFGQAAGFEEGLGQAPLTKVHGRIFRMGRRTRVLTHGASGPGPWSFSGATPRCGSRRR